MKTISQKAMEVAEKIELFSSKAAIHGLIIMALQEQDRETRKACAEAVLSVDEVCETPTGGSAISADDAYEACLNTRFL